MKDQKNWTWKNRGKILPKGTGKRLAELRIKADVATLHLAIQMKVSSSYIYRLEKDEDTVNWSEDLVKQYLAALTKLKNK